MGKAGYVKYPPPGGTTGQALVKSSNEDWEMEWGAGGGGSPGGSNTQVQYNNAGAFGGIVGATTDGTTLTLVAPVLGTPASATLTNATGLPVGGISATGTPDNTTFLRGDGTWNTPTASATLNGIAAATADQAGISNGDWNIVWNWQKTTNSETAFTFGESAASTGGTSTSGVPNQVLVKLSTLAASTMSPLSVYSRAAHVFSVSPTAAQILLTAGSNTVPSIAAAGSVNTGIYWTTATPLLNFTVNGTNILSMYSSYVQVQTGSLYVPNGSVSTLGIYNGSGNAGFFFASNVVAVATAANVENARWAAGEYQVTKATADAVSYAINVRKARGTTSSPTVITTGDVLMTQSAYAYLGATNTYRETGRIEITSAGTISDATTGVGSITTIYGKTQGTDATVQPALVITGGSTATIKFAGSGMVAANNTVATVLGSVGPTGAQTTVQEWLKVDTPSGTRYIPCF